MLALWSTKASHFPIIALRSEGSPTCLTLEHIIIALLDWRIYTGGMIYFGVNCALASISAFLPTIIETFGYSVYYLAV